MRVLAHIHTLNDEDVIEQLVDALRRQSRPPDGILIVDNGSTDGTLDRPFADDVAIIRHRENLGTSGTVHAGFAHALANGYDWIWIFDADSVPRPDVLEKLLAFFERLPSSEQQRVCFLACWRMTQDGEVRGRPIVFTDSRARYLPERFDDGYTECDSTLWSGSLYRLAAAERMGLPAADYVLDVAELEYGYRAREAGFTSYLIHNAVVETDVGRPPGSALRVLRLGPLALPLYELSPIRCYYSARNWIYFWLHQFKPRRVAPALRSVLRSCAFTLSFAIRPVSHQRQLIACLRGMRDGLTNHIERRY